MRASRNGPVSERVEGERQGRRRIHAAPLAALAILAALVVSGCAGSYTEPPTVVGITKATVAGFVFDSADANVTYWFEYGPTTDYGTETTHETIAISDRDNHAVSADLSGLEPESKYHYRLCAKDDIDSVVLCAADESFTTASGGTSDTWSDLAWMYQPSEIVQIHLTLDEAQKTAINTDDPLRDWVGDVGFWMTGSGDKSFASSAAPWRIEAKLKGHTSFRFLDQKAAFNLKFPKDFRPDGLKRMTLNNMVQDASYLRETEAYEIFRVADLPAARTGYAQLWVNDEYYGLYLNLEKYTDQSLAHWFGSLGHLFESARHNDILRSGDDLKDDFEVDEGDEEDWSDLEALSAAARTGSWDEIAARLAQPERVIRYLAAEWYVGQWDGYAWARNNYYLHSDAGGQFTLLPSGLDQSFKPTVPRGDFDLSFPLASALDTWNPPRGPGVLVKACFADPGCSDRFIHELADVKQVADGLDIPAEVNARAEALSSLIDSDPRRESDAGGTSATRGRIISLLATHDSVVEDLLRTHPLTMHTPAITAAPPALTTATAATFEFGLDDLRGVNGFECSLDGAAFTACASPADYENLAVGAHRFEVRAVNDGDTPSPVAAHDWTIDEEPVP